MKNEKLKMKYVLTIIGLLVGIIAYSQDSLSHYLNLAAENNPLVQQKFLEYKAALQKVPQVSGLPDPELSAGVFLSPMELIAGDQVADLRLMQMFPWFGSFRAAKDEMGLMAKAKYESFREVRLQLLFEVRQTWYELYKVKQSIIIGEKNLGLLKTMEKLALAKFQSASINSSSSIAGEEGPVSNGGASQGTQNMGSMSGNEGSKVGSEARDLSASSMKGNSMVAAMGSSLLADIYRIQIETGETENNISLFRSRQNTLLVQFNGYLNRPANATVFVPDTLLPDTLGITLEAVSDSMLAHSPMLEMLQYEQKSIEARKKMITRMGYPMIGLGLNYAVINRNEMSTSAMNGKDMIMPMVSFTLPVYRRKYKAMQTEADILSMAASHNYSALSNNLETEYYQAMQLYHDAQRRIGLYGSQRLLAGKSLGILMGSFAVSGAGLADILRVRQQVLDYDYKQVEAVADLNIAVAWLQRLMAFQPIQ